MSTLDIGDEPRGYHHGDLRNTLIHLGTEMLAESGEASLSLRKLAQRAGVSHNAPYQHFADKDALIAAIAEQGFWLLEQAIEGALQASESGTPVERLIAIGRAYVRFAIGHPSHIQVMFGTFPNSSYPSLSAQAARALDKLIETAQAVEAEGRLNAVSAHDAAAAVWMTVHGLSAIVIAGKLPDRITQNRPVDALAERFVQLLCDGLIR